MRRVGATRDVVPRADEDRRVILGKLVARGNVVVLGIIGVVAVEIGLHALGPILIMVGGGVGVLPEAFVLGALVGLPERAVELLVDFIDAHLVNRVTELV